LASKNNEKKRAEFKHCKIELSNDEKENEQKNANKELVFKMMRKKMRRRKRAGELAIKTKNLFFVVMERKRAAELALELCFLMMRKKTQQNSQYHTTCFSFKKKKNGRIDLLLTIS
jgi:hypothetical protein